MPVKKKRPSKWKKLSRGWKAYIIFTAAVACLCAAFLIHVASIVAEYDRSQPERVMESELEKLGTCIAQGRISDYIDASASRGKYSDQSAADAVAAYESFLSSAKKLDYKLDTGAGKGLEKVYFLTADDKIFAEVKIAGTNERTKLFFFSMADWNVTSVKALPIGGGKQLVLYVPDGVSCTVNGVAVDGSPDADSGDVPKYTVSALPENSVVRYVKADGAEISYTQKGKVITPAVYNYVLTLSPDIGVFVGGAAQSGTDAGEGSLRYEILSMTEPKVTLRDMFGGEYDYRGSDDIPLLRYTVELPDNYKLSASGVEIPLSDAELSDNPDVAELAKYVSGVTLRRVALYTVSAFSDSVKITVTDNLGHDEEYELAAGYAFSITGQSGGDVPAEVLSEIDPMDFAVAWSKFMTNDETFAAITKYFVPDSVYYKEARTWARSIDHTFTSAHYPPVFSDKVTRDYVEYADGCFSVRVSLSKSMKLRRTGETVVDKLDMLVYFVKYNGAWIVAVKHDN